MLPVLLSVQLHAVVAVLFKLVAAFAATFTFKVITEFPAAAIGVAASVQVTNWATAAQIQPVPVPLAKVRPAGSVSVTVITPVLAPAPMLFTVKVYWAPF